MSAARREEAISNLRDLQVKEDELTERRRNLFHKLDRLDIRAPVAGTVYGLQVFAPQAVIRPAEPVLYLVPQDRPLVIITQVKAIDVDQVFVGQGVTVRLPALDQRQTPEPLGQVMFVSADVFQNETSGQSFYRVEIHLVAGELDRLPTGLKLIPGMPVDAFVRTRDRTLLDYLTQPFTDYFAKAFRES